MEIRRLAERDLDGCRSADGLNELSELAAIATVFDWMVEEVKNLARSENWAQPYLGMLNVEITMPTKLVALLGRNLVRRDSGYEVILQDLSQLRAIRFPERQAHAIFQLHKHVALVREVKFLNMVEIHNRISVHSKKAIGIEQRL